MRCINDISFSIQIHRTVRYVKQRFCAPIEFSIISSALFRGMFFKISNLPKTGYQFISNSLILKSNFKQKHIRVQAKLKVRGNRA